MGRISELISLPAPAKSTLGLRCLAQAQGQREQVCFVDLARTFDPVYARRCGIDLGRLVVGTPFDDGEALGMVEVLVRNGDLAALVLDATGYRGADWQAVRSGSMLGRLLVPLTRSDVPLLIVRDREPLGVAYYASVRLQVVRERWIRSQGEIQGYKARIRILVNRFGSAGGSVAVSLMFGRQGCPNASALA